MEYGTKKLSITPIYYMRSVWNELGFVPHVDIAKISRFYVLLSHPSYRKRGPNIDRNVM